MKEVKFMSENTTVGPAGSNGPAKSVTTHQTKGHLANNPDGGFANGKVGDNTTVGPTNGGHDFGGVGSNAVEPGNDSIKGGSSDVTPHAVL